MQDNSIEQYPGSRPETKAERSLPPEQDFAKNFAEGNVPPFAGEQFGVAHQGNEFYGESNTEKSERDNANEYNEGLSNAASLINYGLDAIAREKGVEAVVQGIKSFDASESNNPLRDLYIHLGIDSVENLNDARDESRATKAAREQFRNEYNMPKTQRKSREGAVKAILDMKELITEVEGTDPRYDQLRNAAKAYGKGYFEYAVKDFGLKGLTDLFSVLASQKEQKESEPNQQEEMPLTDDYATETAIHEAPVITAPTDELSSETPVAEFESNQEEDDSTVKDDETKPKKSEVFV